MAHDSDFEGMALFVTSHDAITASKSYLRRARLEEAPGSLPNRLLTDEELLKIDPAAHRYLAVNDRAISQIPAFE